jgi:hypothetical protein
MDVIHRSELIWIRITNGLAMAGAFVPFDDQPSLNGVLVTGIEAMGAGTLSKTPDGSPVATTTDLQKILFTFNQGSDQRHKQLPAVQLDPALNSGVWKEFSPFKVDWQKSGVNMTDNLSATLLSVPVLVHYMYPEDSAG